VRAREGRDAMATAMAIVKALRKSWERHTAPRHVTSPAMRE
jgi:hypothetical protein